MPLLFIITHPFANRCWTSFLDYLKHVCNLMPLVHFEVTKNIIYVFRPSFWLFSSFLLITIRVYFLLLTSRSRNKRNETLRAFLVCTRQNYKPLTRLDPYHITVTYPQDLCLYHDLRCVYPVKVNMIRTVRFRHHRHRHPHPLCRNCPRILPLRKSRVLLTSDLFVVLFSFAAFQNLNAICDTVRHIWCNLRDIYLNGYVDFCSL